MRQVFFLLILSVFQGCSSGNEKPKNCEQSKTGNFILYDHEFNKTYQITRTDTLQTEIMVPENTKYISRVVWLNACDYDLYKIYSDKSYPSVDSLKGNRPTHVSIIKATDDYYIFSMKMDEFERAYSDTLFKAK